MRATVVGGGVVGPAAAEALARRRVDVVLLEREPARGSDATGHNPGAIRRGFDSALNTALTMVSLLLLDELPVRTGMNLAFARLEHRTETTRG